MPKYLHTDELVRGNAFCNAGLFVAILLGLFIGGILVEQPNGATLLSLSLFSASLLGWVAILRAPKAKPTAPDLKLDFNIFTQSWKILSFAFTAPGIARPLLGAAAFYYMTTLVTVLTPIYAQQIWGAGGGVANAIMGLFAIGAGVGAMSAAMLSGKSTGLDFATGGVGASAIFILIIFFLSAGAPGPAPELANGGNLMSIGEFFAQPNIWVLCLAFSASAAALGLYMVPLQAAAQRRAPPERRARILAAGNMMNAAAAMAGSLSVLFVTNTGLSADKALLFVAALQAAITGYMVHRWRSTPRGLYDEIPST
ncbi:MAG: hypothetical protein DHS20C05_20820 [Hyphococcus sp.]|nr:MAG: hypothetical protein DHS20C05_20820 [Marinicaulis sp.]